jgi:aldose 1-epimerase
MPNVYPSGEQIEIRAGDQRAVVVEVGAGLRSYAVSDHDVLDGYDAEQMAGSGRGQVLIPWPNRIQDGAYEFAGTQHQLSLNEPAAGNAIHGLVRWASWSTGQREADRVALAYTLHPQPGYPFSLDLSIEYVLSDEGLRVTTSATNVGPVGCPYGSGQHPYLTLGTEKVDIAGTEYDFREPRPIGATKLDHAFTDLQRDDDGLARVELREPDSGDTLTLWLGESYRYLQLFTGDPLPDVDRRSVAVEPMTCAPNAFRSGDGLLVLEPGESATATWGIQP